MTVEVAFTTLSTIRWRNGVRENVPVKYIFNVNQFTVFVCVCVCFRGALFRVQTLRIRCWFWLVLKAVGRESWPTDCARSCVNSSPMGLFLNIYILELTYLTGTPQVEIINRICTLCLRPQNLSHHKGALLRWAEWCWLPFPQRGRVSEYGSHGALVFFSALLTSGVNEKSPALRL